VSNIKYIREHQMFTMAIEELKKFRPVVPRYSPASSLEEEEHNMRRIRYESGRQDGFDLLMMYLSGDKQ